MFEGSENLLATKRFVPPPCNDESNWIKQGHSLQHNYGKENLLNYTQFIPGNIIPSDHARQSTARDIALDILKTKKIEKIVDLGCGSGNDADWIIANKIEYIGLDIDNSPEVCKRTRKDVKFLTYDGSHFPFSDNSVEMFYSNQVLEHVRRPDLFLSEVSRCLTREGVFVGSVSQLEPYHSFSILNYTFFGIYEIFKQYNLKVFIIRPGIDSITLIKRNMNKFIFGYSTDIHDIFFKSESPLNYLIDEYGKKNRLSIQQINFHKLKISGHISFAASK